MEEGGDVTPLSLCAAAAATDDTANDVTEAITQTLLKF